jgi:tetratricopeptide (TPR) repeat protein
VEDAEREAQKFDELRQNSDAGQRILHNNYVSSLLDVDAPMIRGEIAYRQGRFDDAFELLEHAVMLQDGLNYDEPWGKMQPIRHALGGLLLEQGHIQRAEEVFRQDLKIHPLNPWGLRGLTDCLEEKIKRGGEGVRASTEPELNLLTAKFENQRKNEWADVQISHSCACCGKTLTKSCCKK